MDITTFAQKIKQKYPEYQSVNDSVLVNKFLEKYPVYKSQVSVATKPTYQEASAETNADLKQIGTDIRTSLAERNAKIEDNKARNAAYEAQPKQEASPINLVTKREDATREFSLNPERADNQTAGRTGVQNLGQVLGFGADVIGAGIKGAVKALLPQKNEDKVKENLALLYDNPVVKPLVDKIPVAELSAKYEDWKKANPNKAADVDAFKGFLEFASNFVGAEGAGIAGKEASIAAKEVGAQAFEQGAKLVDDVAVAGSKIASETTSAVNTISKPIDALAKDIIDPEKIMQRVARIPKPQQAKFQKLTGESVGEYLVNRGIYGNEEEILTKLYDRFSTSKSAADEGIAALEGTFKPKQVGTAIDELLKKEVSVSSAGAMSKDIKRVMQLKNKYRETGLNMSEINEIKRLYEKNVTIDYLKQNLPDKVTRARNIDSAIREWQFQKADELGLKNLPDINKETQAAKQLLDDFGKELAGSAGNNAIGLSDTILMASGDPRVIGLFITKKLLGSKKFMSTVAKTLSKGKKIGIPKAEFGKPRPSLEEFMKKY